MAAVAIAQMGDFREPPAEGARKHKLARTDHRPGGRPGLPGRPRISGEHRTDWIQPSLKEHTCTTHIRQ